MAELRDEKLDFWLKNNLNVLLIGPHGVGKTARVLDAFERAKLRYRYFSAATMDPWVDFVGIPKEVKDDKGSYLELVLPKDLRDDNIDALFFDEFNRSHKKVRNAVMELIQRKSINGRKFHNLRVVWAAINPDDEEEYQVEPLDPAQKGRFQVKFNVPSEPSKSYFTQKFDGHIAKAAISWWEELPPEIRKLVDPRSLDHALDMHRLGGDMKDVLPKACNPAKLVTTLKTGPIGERMKELFAKNDPEEARKFLAIENNYASALPHLASHKDWYGFFLPTLAPEKLSSLMSSDDKVKKFILALIANHPDKAAPYRRVIQDILQAGLQKKLVKEIKKVMGSNQLLASQFGYMTNINAAAPHFNKRSPVKNWSNELQQYAAWPQTFTPQRLGVYQAIASNIPEQLTPQEAVDTLELLNKIAMRAWAKSLHNMPKVMGVINHCIDQIHKKTTLSWPEILSNYGSKFDKLLAKINEAKLQDKLFCPVKQPTVADARKMLEDLAAQGNPPTPPVAPAQPQSLKEVVLGILKAHKGPLPLWDIVLEVSKMVSAGTYRTSATSLLAVVSQAINNLQKDGDLAATRDTNGKNQYAAV